jgi:hypothetical protein
LDPVPLDLPEGQLLHSLAPAELEYCPEGQLEHPLAPVELEYCPEGQFLQALELRWLYALEYCPAQQ